VATIGIVILSIAVGGYVVGSNAMDAAQADEARNLVGATPTLVAIGLVHLLAAVALVRGRDVLRLAAVLASGLAAVAAASSAAMFAVGVDPISWSGVGHASTSGLGILAILGVLYGMAAVVAGSGPPEV
jgi:predicted nicotinamide N-methyase